MRLLRTVLLATILSFLGGCAGKDFVRPNSEAFRLGQTTHAQVIQQRGEPRNTGEALTNGKSVKTATYVYATAVGEPLEE